MERVSDNFGSFICMADAATGRVESRYKDFTICGEVPIGGALVIFRGNKTTIVRRTPKGFTAVSTKRA